MFDGNPKLSNSARNLGDPPKNFSGSKASEFWRDFGQRRDLIANISEIQQDIVKWKTAISPAHIHLI